MSHFIISDMHLDDSTGPFTQLGNKPKLMDFLDMVGSEPLIINGDGLDLWAWPLDKILAANGDIVSRLQKHPNLTYLIGNHDLEPDTIKRQFPNANVVMSLALKGWSIIHGYQFDPELNKSWKRWLVDEADKLIHDINDPLLIDFSNRVSNNSHGNDPLIKALEGTKKNYILGHSHIAAELGWFVNEGCWCNQDPSYALMDDAGKVELKFWANPSRITTP